MFEEKSIEFNIWTFVEEKKAYIISFLLSALVVSLIYSLLLNHGNSQKSGEVVYQEAKKQNEEKIDLPGRIYMDLSGAILRPGVYEVSEGARVADAISMSGSFVKEADRVFIDKCLNLSEKLKDESKIYIPFRGEYIATGGDCRLNQKIVKNDSGTNLDLININNSDSKELETLPGIGPTYAERIIKGRPYDNLDDFSKKSQLSKSVLEKIKDKVTF